MALDPTILRKIRYETGKQTELGVDDDDTIEIIFNDSDEGNSSVLATALIVWRFRLGSLTDRAFDITTEGSLLSRSQKIRFIERRIKELELITESTAKGHNAQVTNAASQSSLTASSGSAELS